MEIPINIQINKSSPVITEEVEIPLDPMNFIRLDGQNQIPTLWVDGDINTFNPMEYGTTPITGNNRVMFYDFRDMVNVVLSKIQIYDGTGTQNPPMLIYGIDKYNKWTQLVSFDGASYNIWRTYTFSPIAVKFLAFRGESAGIGAGTKEFKVFGEYENAGIIIPSTFPVKSIPFSQLTGTNGYPWSLLRPSRGDAPQWKIDVAKQYKVFRVYHDWRYIEHLDKGAYAFHSSHNGGWMMDWFYQRCKENGIIAIPTLQGIPQYLINTWTPASINNRQQDGRMNSTDIWAYVDSARALFNMAARYGNGDGFNVLGTIENTSELPGSPAENDTYLLKIYVDGGAQEVISRAYTWKSGEWKELLNIDRVQKWANEPMNSIKIGLNTLDYIEVGNESNRSWHGRNGMQVGKEHAAQLSAVYDGHMGTMGDGVGIKHASSNIKVTTTGIAGIHYNFFMGIIYWSIEHRGFNEDGTVNVPFDILNFHTYRNTQGSEQHQGTGRKGMAPEPSGYFETAYRLRELIWRYLKPETELILGETGYDINTGSPQAPVPFGSYNTEDLQGIFTLRTMLESARAGIDFVTPYEIIDNSSDINSTGLYMTTGMNNRDVEPWTPRVISKFIVQIRDLIDTFVYDGEVDLTPVRCIRFKQGTSYAYFIWLPIEGSGSESYSLTSLPSHTTATLHVLDFYETETIATPLTPNTSYSITATEVPKLIILE